MYSSIYLTDIPEKAKLWIQKTDQWLLRTGDRGRTLGRGVPWGGLGLCCVLLMVVTQLYAFVKICRTVHEKL